MSAAGEALRYALAIGIAAVAVVLVVNGVRNTLYAWTLARYKVLQQDVTGLKAVAETQNEAVRIIQEQLAALHTRCDALATRQTALRLVAMTPQERERGYERLVHALKEDGPDDAPSSGPDDPHVPPARDSGRKADPS